jgi:formylglycine-generating enzyme required for sulfatase activity
VRRLARIVARYDRTPPAYLRAAVRGRQPQDYRYVNAGLRIARTLAP